MSLILDALNRSRQDEGEVPGLDSRHPVADVDGPRGRLLLVAALVAALLVIALLLWERGGDGDVVTAQALPQAPPQAQSQPQPVAAPEPPPPAAPQPAEPAQAVAAQPPTVAPASEIAAPVPDAAVAALYKSKPAQRATPAAEVDAPAAASPVPGRERQADAAPAAEPVAESEQPVDIEALLRQAENELENARLEEHEAPFLATLSQQTKDRIPTIFYERHDYSGTPGQSAVVLNGAALKPGGRTSSGVRVEEILPDSVVLSYQGTQFRLRALNSWVNL